MTFPTGHIFSVGWVWHLYYSCRAGMWKPDPDLLVWWGGGGNTFHRSEGAGVDTRPVAGLNEKGACLPHPQAPDPLPPTDPHPPPSLKLENSLQS